MLYNGFGHYSVAQMHTQWQLDFLKAIDHGLASFSIYFGWLSH
jgi:hypothetical protein